MTGVVKSGSDNPRSSNRWVPGLNEESILDKMLGRKPRGLINPGLA